MAHIMAAGMGGIRTAGDLVAWMQMTRQMKIAEARQYVASKLGIGEPGRVGVGRLLFLSAKVLPKAMVREFNAPYYCHKC